MSVRAYKAIKIETEDEAEFNLWYDDEVYSLLHLDAKVNADGGGLISVSIEEVEEALKGAKRPGSREILQRVRQACQADGYAEYLCW